MNAIGLPFNPDVLNGLAQEEFARHEVRLNPVNGLPFDGRHQIDLVLRVTANSVVACELKLGTTALAYARVADLINSPCIPTHDGTRWGGNMMSALQRNFQDPLGAPVHAAHLTVNLGNEPLAVAINWILIVRDNIRNALVGNGFGETFPNVTLIGIESLIHEVGGPPAFNQAAQEVVSFDYFETWFH